MTAGSADGLAGGEVGPALVLGNSHVGALIKAAALAPEGSPLRHFHFAAAGGINFRRIGVAEGRLVGVRSLRDQLLPLDRYGTIFIYGDLPHVIDLVVARRKLVKRLYSTQVQERALRNLVEHCASLALRRLVADASPARIVLLPGNPPVNAAASLPDERAPLQALLDAAPTGEVLSSPPALVSPDGVPAAAFYRDSVDITGEPVAEDAQPKHDIFHYNPEGGAIWLAALTEVLAGTTPGGDRDPGRQGG